MTATVTDIATAKPRKQPKSQRALSQKEFAQALRKIKPHLPAAISTASAIMNCQVAKDNDRLKAAALLLNYYVQFVSKTYQEDTDGNLVDDAGPEVVVDLTKF